MLVAVSLVTGLDASSSCIDFLLLADGSGGKSEEENWSSCIGVEFVVVMSALEREVSCHR